MSLCGMLLICLGALAIPTAETQDAVDVSNNTLRTIPSKLPTNITKLKLSNNFIQLSSSDMGALSSYQSLTELTLDRNLITTLPDNLLSTLPKLRILNLSHNNISVLPPEAFSKSSSLIELDLSYNHVASLQSELFKTLSSLRSLHLQSNSLQTLELEASVAVDRLQRLTLEDNPWECSCKFVTLMKLMNSSGLLKGTQAKCSTPKELLDKSIINDDACPSNPTQAPASAVSTMSTTRRTSTQSSTTPKPSNDPKPSSHSNKDSVGHQDGGSSEGTTSSGGLPSVGNTWKLLVGVVVIALSTSVVIVCAVKSPSWYKLLFNYRHQRLREEGGPNRIWATAGRYSNFSLETEQTETSAHELEEGLECDMQEEMEEDEDGFIEDRYIEPGDYKEHNES